MEIAELTYDGELRTSLRHLSSGERLTTDAPTDNAGKGEAFSPTDLVCVSLASCMVTIMGIRARKNGFELGPLQARIHKTMQSNPRKVAEIKVIIEAKNTGYTAEQQEMLIEAARSCPVALSLHPDIRQELTVTFK